MNETTTTTTPASNRGDETPWGVYMTRKELAERWRMSRSRLATLASEGRSPVPFVKLAGGHVLYRTEDVLRYEDELLQGAQVAA